MADPDLPGFSYDPDRARAIARLVQHTLGEAGGLGAPPTDQLAALGFAAATLMRGTGFGRVQERAIAALAAFIRETLALTP